MLTTLTFSSVVDDNPKAFLTWLTSDTRLRYDRYFFDFCILSLVGKEIVLGKIPLF
ncbi:MAG: hypothetical protein V7K89_21185 [Nostoc sp.]|uniref:hypothetical protein n=1 Tax=Nostoc sp. TaxID=1180 RepID=UPI002FF9AB21